MMYDDIHSDKDANCVFSRFPWNDMNEKTNPAVYLYGLRFYKDQTPIEYLAEFLLVFASPKHRDRESGAYSLKLDTLSDFEAGNKPRYFPKDRVALKLLAFFPSSKQETRHVIHRFAYMEALENLKATFTGSKEDKDNTVRLIQSLFNGFVGVAKNRTWVTYSFLPASTALLARELDWLHSGKYGAKTDTKLSEENISQNNAMDKWEYASRYFAADRHNFMARGGELLFLQLANLYEEVNYPELVAMQQRAEYTDLRCDIKELIEGLEGSLGRILDEGCGLLENLANLVEKTLWTLKFKNEDKDRGASLGWVPKASRIEALLFAVEIRNICSSSLSALEKLDLLKILCCMQVLRSLCFQARRVDDSEPKTYGFIGNYTWIVADPEAKPSAPIRKMAQNSYEKIEQLLYRVLRSKKIPDNAKQSVAEGDKHGFDIFRKISKEIGLVVPPKGAGQRFTLHQGLVRFLVAVLVPPGEPIRLTHFYERVFAHYGMAIGGQQLVEALAWMGNESNGENYAVSTSTGWVEETLQQGGFLVELSDAVSIVSNPG